MQEYDQIIAVKDDEITELCTLDTSATRDPPNTDTLDILVLPLQSAVKKDHAESELFTCYYMSASILLPLTMLDFWTYETNHLHAYHLATII